MMPCEGCARAAVACYATASDENIDLSRMHMKLRRIYVQLAATVSNWEAVLLVLN
jgi:hypothetical protein